MKKTIMYPVLIFSTLLIIQGCSSVSCKFLGPYYNECPSSGFVTTLTFTGFTIDEVKGSALYYYKQDGSFRQKIQTIQFADAFEIQQYGVVDTNVTVKYSASELYHAEYDWEIVMKGRTKPYRLTNIQFKKVKCCSQNKPTTALAFDSYVLDKKKQSLNHFQFNKYIY
jgi:hypothetical protein